MQELLKNLYPAHIFISDPILSTDRVNILRADTVLNTLSRVGYRHPSTLSLDSVFIKLQEVLKNLYPAHILISDPILSTDIVKVLRADTVICTLS